MAALVVPLAALAVMFTTGAASGSGGTDANGQPSQVDPTAQCGLPLSQRHGGWVCIDQAASRKMMEASMKRHGQPVRLPDTSTRTTTVSTSGSTTTSVTIDNSPAAKAYVASAPAVAESTTGDGVAGWCNSIGCWYLWNENPFRHSEFDGFGPYGYGSTTLGTMTTYVLDTLLSSTSLKIENQSKWASRGSNSNSWYDVLYFVNSTYPYGKICGSSQQSAGVNKAANSTFSWAPIYFDARNCGISTQAVFHRITWRDPSSAYPGRWYFFSKSAKYTFELGYQLHFIGSVDTPSAPLGGDGAGWQNV